MNNLSVLMFAFSYEDIPQSLGLFLMAMGAIFTVILIVKIIALLYKFLWGSKSEESAAAQSPAAEAAAPTPAAADNGAVVAAIMAAIEAYRSAEGNDLPYRVVSYRRKSGSRGWSGEIDD